MSDPNPSGAADPVPPAGSVPEGNGRPRRPVLGFALLAVGVLFAMHQLGLPLTDRWWTVFILVPAAGLLVAATRFYRSAGRWIPPAVATLIGGVLMMGLWAKLFFGGAWHAGSAAVHAAGWHAMAWHGPFFAGHFLLPVVLLVMLVLFLARRSRWQR